MNDEPGGHEPSDRPVPPGSYSQDIRHTSVSARVPEKVGRGVFSSASMILQSHEEFVIDFLSTVTSPQQVVARVVMTGSTFTQFVAALQANIAAYEQHFGRLVPHHPFSPLPPQPAGPPGAAAGEATPGAGPGGGMGPGMGSAMAMAGMHDHPSREPGAVPAQPPSIEELYGQLKLPDDMLGGAFANVIMIRHTPEEFCFDFIVNFYPRSSVTSRVFMAAGRIPSFVDAMANALQRFRDRLGAGPMPPSPPVPPENG